jgi:hypothetical protein
MSDIQDWKQTLPEEMRGSPALKDIKDVGALAKNYLEAQSAIGASVRIPSKEAGEEGKKAFRARMLEVGKDHGLTVLPGEDEAEQAAFYTALGRPAEAKLYEIPDAKAENLKFDAAEAEAFKAVAHAAGLSSKQYKKVVAEMAKSREGGAAAATDKFNSGHADLKKEWGQAYDSRRDEVGKRLAIHNAPASLIEAFKEGLVDADSTRWLHGVMTALGDEPQELTSQGKRSAGIKLTPGEAMERVAEVEAKLDKMNPGDADYPGLVKRRVELIEIANSA